MTAAVGAGGAVGTAEVAGVDGVAVAVGPVAGAGVEVPWQASGGEAEPELEPDSPHAAACRYRDLLGASDVARARAGQDARSRRQGTRAQARRHREAAADIRTRVENVWAQVSEPLAQYGLTDLDQVRPATGETTPAGPVALTKKSAARGRGTGRPLASAGHAGWEGRTDRDPRGGGMSGDGRGERPGRGARAGREGGRGRGRGRGPGPGGAGAPAPVDPRTAPRQAYELCLDAMSKAAELRAVTKGAESASAGLVTALASLLSLVVVGLLRLFTDTPGMPGIIGAAVLSGGLVVAAAGMEAGVKPALRAGVLGAGMAAVAVLATFRLAPTDVVDVAGSLVALAAASRFGLGLGAPAQQQAAGRAGGSRKG